MRKLILAALLALAGAFLGASPAQALTYQNGDLFLGVRASGGDGAGQDYLVNIGPASQYTSAGGAYTVPGLGDIAADLSALFGADWSTRADLFWSISGGNLPADPENTLYASRTEPVGSRAIAWKGNSPSAQGVVNSKFGSLATTYKLGVATANGPTATIQNTADFNSYASFQPGGTTVNANGQSFAAFSPSIEASFANGPAGSALDLFRILPVYDQYSQDLGSFTLSASGVLSFTPAPTVSEIRFTNAQFTVDEDTASGKAYLNLQRSGSLAQAVSVQVSTTAGTASAPTDFTSVQNVTVTFAPYETQGTVEVPIAVRADIQGNRDFTATLSSPSSNATLGTITVTTVTIVESETPGGKLNFTFKSYQKTEGAAADTTLTVSVTRTNGKMGAANVQLAATGGTASAGSDYTLAAPLTLQWADGDTATKTVDIIIKADGVNEPIETILLALQSPTNAVLGTKTESTVSIFDGTPAVPGNVFFTSASYTQNENALGNATVDVSVTRSTGTNAVTVGVGVTGGTASAGVDYTGAPATLSWAAGESGPKTLTLTIKPDALAEGDETIVLGLQNPTGGLTVATPSTATVTILDPLDTTAPSLTIVSPKTNAKLSGSQVTVSGIATDNLSVSRVEVSLNGGPAQSVTPATAGATFNYSVNVNPEPGLNTVQVTAFDAVNTASTVVSRSFTFTLQRPALAGKYNGLLLAEPTATVERNGLVNVAVTPTGTFTGKVTIGAAKITVRGTFSAAGEAKFGTQKTSTVELTQKVGPTKNSYGFLALTLNTGTGKTITGTLKDSASVTLATLPHADLAIYTAKNNPVAPLLNVPVTLLDPTKEKGKYTAIFQAQDAPNNTLPATSFPQGDGYGFVTISKAGVVKITGKLADGSIISYANTLSAANTWPLYLSLYKKTGFLRGDVTFDPANSTSDAAANDLLWVKKANPADKVYPAGWPTGISVDFAASKYLVPGHGGNSGSALGSNIAIPANIAITLADGGLPANTSKDATVNAASKVTIIGPTAGSTGATSLSVKIAPATGAVTGSFTHPASTRKVTFQGAAFQKTGQATGYFLYTPTGGTAVSGSIGISQPAVGQ